jgi:hypothetical protein
MLCIMVIFMAIECRNCPFKGYTVQLLLTCKFGSEEFGEQPWRRDFQMLCALECILVIVLILYMQVCTCFIYTSTYHRLVN